MTGDLRRKVEDSQSGFERLVGSVPGYKGYKERELRREADRLLRRHLARRFSGQRRRLTEAMGQLTAAGRLQELPALEKANLKLELLIDRLNTAAHGYAGLFDALKIEQQELDALYEYDASLAGGVDRVAEVVTAIRALVGRGETTAAEATALLDVLEEINDIFGRRMEVIAG
ncbi:MAG: hypothetical protein QME94_08200 [Anaerolineae bacterium]|nr:hypothetical protein [Anaerolineae bacterium]